MKIFLSLFAVFFSLNGFAQPTYSNPEVFTDACQTELTAYGAPIGAPQKVTTLCRTAYLLEHFDACKNPLLVAQRLRGANLSGSELRSRFIADPDLSAEKKALPKDYHQSGFDMGHLAPAADFHASRVEMLQSFYLSNASPQNSKMNRGVWRLIEIKVRKLAMSLGEIFVITGVTYDKEPRIIGNGVCIGSGYYKVIFDKRGNSIAYYVKNDSYGLSKPELYQTTVAEVEKLAEINFTPLLAPEDALKLKGVIGAALK